MEKIKGICFRLDSQDRASGHGSLNRYERQKGFIFVSPGGALFKGDCSRFLWVRISTLVKLLLMCSGLCVYRIKVKLYFITWKHKPMCSTMFRFLG